MKRKMTRLLSIILTLAMCAGLLPASALATVVAQNANGVLTVTDDQGNVQTVDKSWEETFPYGTFALANPELTVQEGGSVSLTVYRLGGTRGRATAFVEYSPAVSLIGENDPTFAFAAGWDDLSLRVEDPSPLARYQPVGGIETSMRVAGIVPSIDPIRTTDNTMDSSRRQVLEYGDTCYHLPGVEADSYQWQLLQDPAGDWEDVSGATLDYFLVGNDMVFEYDFRCIYTIGEDVFCTDSVYGVEFVPERAETLPEVPDDLTVPDSPTYTSIPDRSKGQSFETYETVRFPVTFAEGEYEKTIWFDTSDDRDTESDEFGIITIVDCEGGSLYNSANKSTLQILDNEEKSPTELSLSVSEAEFDRAAGEAVFTVKRTGDITYPVSVAYKTGGDGDTAIAGTHYAHTEGVLLFQGDVDELKITVPLISGENPDEERYTLTVTLGELLGGRGTDTNSLASLGSVEAQTSLYDTGTQGRENVNLATLLSGGDGEDVSGSVGEAEPVSSPAETLTGEAVVPEAAETVEAEIHYEATPQTRTYTYPAGTLTFKRGENYKNEFWCDWEVFADKYTSMLTSLDYSSTVGYNDTNPWYKRFETPKGDDGKGAKEFYEDDGALCIKHNATCYASLKINDGALIFDSFKGDFYYSYAAVGTAGKDKAVWLRPNDYIRVYGFDTQHDSNFKATFKDGKPSLDKFSMSADQRTDKYTISWADKNLNKNNPDTSFSISMGLYATLWNSTTTPIFNDTANDNGIFRLDQAALRRRAFTKDLGLTIYTANDADVLKGEDASYARLDVNDPVSGGDAGTLYDNIKPQIKLVKNKSGVNKNGKLYVGSTVQISLASTASYEAPDCSGSTDYSVFLTEKGSSEILVRGISQGTDTAGRKLYNLTMLWDGMRDKTKPSDFLTGEYVLHVVMDRTQQLLVDLTPSVPRAEDGITIDTSEEAVKVAFNNFKDRKSEGGSGNIKLWYGDPDSDSPFFEEDDKTTRKSNISYSNVEVGTNTAVLKLSSDSRNLYAISFDLPSADRIVFNGRIYKGNEKIYLQVKDLAQADLRFYYYHEDYLNIPSIMTANIDHATLFLDANGNGQIDGYFDTGTYTFTPTAVGGVYDEIVTTFGNKQVFDLDERYTEPVIRNGKACAYFLQTWYSMNPRKLEAGPGDDKDLTATVRPAFTTAVTNENVKKSLSQEQRDYRYLNAGLSMFSANGNYTDSAAGKPIFGEAASAINYVIIPLGGDYSPPTLTSDGTAYEWTPNYQGNLLKEFTQETAKSVAPITLANTVVGKNFPVAKATTTKAADGSYTYTYDARNLSQLNGYLGSFLGATTFNLSVMAPTTEDKTKDSVESVTRGNMSCHPNSEYLKSMNGNSAGEDTMDMGESDNAYDEYNMDFNSELGATNLNVSDYFTIIVNGYEVGFSIGLPVGGYHSNGDAGTGGTGGGSGSGSMYGPGAANRSRTDELAGLKDWINSSGGLSPTDDSYAAATKDDGTEKKYAAKGMGVELSLRLAMIWKYNPLDNGYYFSNMTISIAGNLVFTFMYRLSVCPIVYAYFKVGAGLEVTTGLGVSRQSKTATLASSRVDTAQSEPLNYADPLKLAVGDSVVFKTKYKALDITFDGSLLMEVSENYDRASTDPNKNFVPIDKIGNTDLRTGVISSGGGGPMTVVLAEKDGNYLKVDNEYYYVRLTATKDTELTKVIDVIDARTLVYWTGMTLTPSAYLEVGVGIGVELLKVELFVSTSVTFKMIIGGFDTVTEKYGGFEFTDFEFTLGMTLRVVAIVFNFDFDLVRYTLTYGPKGYGSSEKVWKHGFKALGGAVNESGEIKSRSRGGETEEPMLVTVNLPESTAFTQQIYAPDSDIPTRAIQPSSSDVPFQLSGYGSSTDAFKLVDGLVTGRNYEVVTVGENNYLLYTLSRGNASDTPAALDDPMLVMSRIKVTAKSTGSGDSYGLVNPVTGEAGGYIPVDDDDTGDLGFSVWAEGNNICVSWVSYASVNEDAIPEKDDERLDFQAMKAKNTVVKRAVFDAANITENSSFGTPTIVTGTTTTPGAEGEPDVTTPNVGSNVYLPAGGGDAVFYAKASHYTQPEQTAAEAAYLNYLNLAHATPEPSAEASDGDKESQDLAYQGIRDFLNINRKSDYGLYGKGATLNLWTGEELNDASVPLAGWELLGNLEFTKKDGGGWRLAYTTYDLAYYDRSTNTTVTDFTNVPEGMLDEAKIQRLYLRDVSVTEENGVKTVNWGTAKLVRTLLDFDIDNENDGRYSGSTRVGKKYEDPTFANLRFLTAKLGSSLTGGEGPDNPYTRQGGGDTPETFLLFDMMGSTYVIPAEDMTAILTGDSSVNNGQGGLVYPFFVPEQKASDTLTSASTGRIGVSIGADADGNLAAVYSEPMAHTGNNGLFVSWYDTGTSQWGQGKLLAMQHMQVYEDGAKYGLDNEQMEKAYLGEPTGNADYDAYINDSETPATSKGSMKQFQFSDLQIALGKKNDEAGEEGEAAPTLLVLGQGAQTNLERITVPETVPEQTLVAPKGAASTGFYAVSFGAGKQKVGDASLTLADYGFSAGDILQSYVKFTNVGDAGFRADTDHPITVTLNASKPGDESGGDATSVKVAEWKMYENILAGQAVSLISEGEAACTLGADLPVGTEFTLTVAESTKDDYFTDPAVSTTPSLLTVEDKPELGFETLEIVTEKLDENGNTILTVNGSVSNRGNATAEDVYVQFSYQTGETEVTEKDKVALPIYTPLNLTGHTLTVGEQTPLPTRTRGIPSGIENGILVLENESESAETKGKIEPNSYRTIGPRKDGETDIQGTITVPADHYYSGDPNKALNLRVEIFSKADNVVVDSATGLHTSDHAGEYKTVNNTGTVSVSPKTWFASAGRVAMALGNTMRLPLTHKSTTGNTSALTVSEVSENAEGWTPSLDVLYYDEQSKNLVVVPSKEGKGYIRVADPETASFTDIYYIVDEVGAGINIFEDNELFTFSKNNWTFDKSATFGSGSTPPYRNDLSIGKNGATVTFPTSSKSIDLYFYGDVEVKSDLPKQTGAVLLKSTDGSKKQTISFGDNTDQTVHNVTITVKSEGTQLDRLMESFAGNKPPTPADSVTAPQIYWSRSFPDTASIKTGEKTVELTGYVLDDGTLNSLTVNGVTPDNLVKNADNFWQFTLNISENGNISVVATDTSGKATNRNVMVSWFAAIPSVGADDSAPTLEGVKFTKADGTELASIVKEGPIYLTYSPITDTSVSVFGSRYHTDENEAAFKDLGAETQGKGFPLSTNDVYRVMARDSEGNWRSVIRLLDKLDDTIPRVYLYRNTGEYTLHYVVEKTGDAALTTVTINGDSVLSSPSTKSKRLDGDWDFSFAGTYTLFAGDEAGNENSLDLTLTNIPVSGGTEAYTLVHPWNQAENNGSITIHPNKITGGKYVAAETPGAYPTKYKGSYEYAFLDGEPLDKSGAEFDALLGDDNEWKTLGDDDLTLDGLKPNSYTLYIRDKQDSENKYTVLVHSFTTVSKKTGFDLEVTQSVQRPNSNDGIFTATAWGGNSGTGTYEFSLMPITGTHPADTDPSDIPLTPISSVTGWQNSEAGVENSKVFSPLATGWYQLSVRDKGLDYTDSDNWANAVTRAVYMPQRSGDASLSHLAVVGYAFTPSFSSDITEYRVVIPSDINLVTLEAVTNNSSATIRTGDVGDKSPDYGYNSYSVLVTAEDETTKREYKISLTRIYQDDDPVNSPHPPISSAGNDWDSIRRTIEKSEDGSVVTVDMNGSDTLPGTVQDALAGKDVTLVLNSDNSLRWNINGTDVPEGAHSDVDMGVSIGGNAIPDQVVNNLAGDNPSVQLTLDASGELGLTAALNVNLGSGYAGQWANLYYYPGTGGPVFRTAVRIGEDGRALMDFTRGGDYLIVLDDHAHGEGWDNPFTDVSESDWFYNAVRYVNQKGLLQGTDETHFSPDMTMSRAMMVTVLYRLSGDGKPAGGSSFTDVPDGQWYTDAVIWAAANGIVKGYDDGRFGTGDSITREQLAAVLYRYATYMKLDVSTNSDISLSDYMDYGDISEYALEATRWACKSGVITGKPGGRLDPTGTASRAEAAAMLMRFCENIKPKLRGNRP